MPLPENNGPGTSNVEPVDAGADHYVGVKFLEAKEVTKEWYCNYRGWDVPADEDKEEVGYMVFYPDGYISWSPAKQFHEAYRIIPRVNVDEIQLDNIFTYHAPEEQETIDQYNAIRMMARQFYKIILMNTPRCADQSAALRKVREAVMTANAAIATKGAV